MNQSYSVKAILRTDKKRVDGSCPIHYRITIDKKTLKLPSGEYEFESNWNKKDGFVKGSKTSQVNCLLDSQISAFKDYLRQQKSLGNIISIDLMKSYYSKEDKESFDSCFDKFCVKKFKELSPGTQQHYRLLKKRVLEFKPNLKVQDIDLKFIENLDAFLREKSVITDAGLFNRHKNMKTFIRFAIKEKLLNYNPYEDFKMPRCKQKFDHITSNELRKLQNLILTGRKNETGLGQTLDMFLFSCYTGMRYSDVQKLKWSNINNMKYITMDTQKTKSKLIMPLPDLAIKIIMRYKKFKIENVFPYRSNPCLNRNLKEIAALSGINKEITFHMARHTYATILANNNVNPFHIAKLMTHSNLKQTMTYVNSSVSALEASVSKISEFS